MLYSDIALLLIIFFKINYVSFILYSIYHINNTYTYELTEYLFDNSIVAG